MNSNLRDIIILIIIFTIGYYSYYYSHPAIIKDSCSLNTLIKSQVFTDEQIIKIKNNFTNVDNNFSNRIIHTSNGIILERIK